MPRVRYPLTDFSRGEVSPTLEGRIDLDQYRRGARRMLNATILEEGGATRRPGTRYVAPAKTPTSRVRLARFEASNGEAFVLEFTEGAIRFYNNGVRVEVGGVPVEVATPYLALDLLRLKLVPVRDVLFIFCQFYQTRRLEHYATTVWKLKTHPPGPTYFPKVPPSYEYGERPVATLTAGAVTGLGVTFTAGAAQFLVSDVGRSLAVFAGANISARAIIRSFVSTTQVTADITDDWANLAATAATDWKMTDSPIATITPSAVGTVGGIIQLTLGAAGWRATDVGKQVSVNGGIAIITNVVSTTVVDAQVLVVLSATTAAQPGAWSLEEGSWSSFNGFPGAGADFQGRLWAGGTLAQPWQLWGSATDDYDSWPVGVNADDAVSFGLTTSQIRWLLPSRALLVGGSRDEAQVDGGGSGGDSVITPTTVRERPETTFGATDEVSPERVGSVSLFASRSGKKLRELVYTYESDSYVAPDLLLLSKHLTRDTPLVTVAHQQEPTSTIWAVRSDGTLLGCTYLRDQNVVGWHRHVTDGNVESVAVIPHPLGGKDQVWLAVVRIIGGAETRYIERFDDDGWYYRQLHLDAAITYDFTQLAATVQPAATFGMGVTFTGTGGPFPIDAVGQEIRRIPLPGRAIITTRTNADLVTADIVSDFPDTSVIPAGEWALSPVLFGLPHLEGKTVEALVDGAVVTPAGPVTGGVLTMTETGVRVEIGLGYDTELESMPADILQLGTTAPLDKRKGEFYVKFFETLGAEIEGEQVTFRQTSDRLGVAVPIETLVMKKVRMRGYDEDATVTLAQRQPLPFTVLFVALRYSVGS